MDGVEEFHEFNILLLTFPGQLDSHIFVIFEVGFAAINDDGVVYIAAYPPEQFQEISVFLYQMVGTYRQ
jgi:hypothetical protein